MRIYTTQLFTASIAGLIVWFRVYCSLNNTRATNQRKTPCSWLVHFPLVMSRHSSCQWVPNRQTFNQWVPYRLKSCPRLPKRQTSCLWVLCRQAVSLGVYNRQTTRLRVTNVRFATWSSVTLRRWARITSQFTRRVRCVLRIQHDPSLQSKKIAAHFVRFAAKCFAKLPTCACTWATFTASVTSTSSRV